MSATTFLKARKAGCPIIAIETPDMAATVIACQKQMNGKSDAVPIVKWDIISGLTGVNKTGIDYAQEKSFSPLDTGNPTEALIKLNDAEGPKGLIAFIYNAHLILRRGNEPELANIQAIWNCRDTFKAKKCSLVLLAPTITIPPELARDTILLSEELPRESEFNKLVESICTDASIPKPTDAERPAILDTLLGLSSFEAEQALALSLSKAGIDRADLWTRKVKAIEQTEGLTVYRGKEKFSDLGGLDNAKKIVGDTLRGKLKISCIVFFDEADKSFAAANTDTSGTTQDQNKVLLSYMQDFDIKGKLFYGPPGTGKTQLCKCAANEYGIPLIMFDLGAMKGSLVGQSEQKIRAALKIIHAISDGRALFIAACNRSENLPPELRRRFNYASLFFDLPDPTERGAALALYVKKFELTTKQTDWTPPQDWTAAEIRNACLKSWAMDIPLSEAAKTIVPIAKSAGDLVQNLRKSAAGKYISATHPGLYDPTRSATPATEPQPGRRIEV